MENIFGKNQCDDVISLSKEISACRICVDHPLFLPPLPHQPRPVAYLSSTAKVVIAGQAPGLRVHETGTPFNDRSGDRLRQWLGVSREEFYDRNRFAIVPMGFCFPGYSHNKSDLPPRKECKIVWHDRIFNAMPQVELVLAIGGYAQKYHIGGVSSKKVSEIVMNWKNILSIRQSRGYYVLPLPHPSWRNTAWINKNPWFEEELLPKLKCFINKYSVLE